MEPKRMSASERQTFMDLVVAMTAVNYCEKLEPRFNAIKGGKWMYRTAKGIINKLYAETLQSCPLEQIKSIQRQLHGLRYSLHIVNVNGKDRKNDGFWLSWEALDHLTNATRDHCLVCMKSVEEQRKCPLAKALDELPCVNANENARGCRYTGGLI